MNIPDNFQVIDHALIHHKLGLIRDKNTGSKEFRELVTEATMLLGYEATKDLSLKDAEVQTPITTAQVKTVEVADIVLVPIMRAGLSMAEGMLKLIPNARVGCVGMERDHETHQWIIISRFLIRHRKGLLSYWTPCWLLAAQLLLQWTDSRTLVLIKSCVCVSLVLQRVWKRSVSSIRM